jgi:hypothetical protein
MKKQTNQKIKRFTPESFVRDLLNEAGFPKTKKFTVRNRNGRLVVRFNQNKYE